MIHYKYGRYGIGLIWKRRGSLIQAASIVAVFPTILALGLRLFFSMVLSESQRQVLDPPDSVHRFWNTFTWVLGVVLIFRTNQGYERYWEGTRMLHLLTEKFAMACSQCSGFVATSGAPKQKKDSYQGTMVRLFSLLHCLILQQVSVMDDIHFEVIDGEGLGDQYWVDLSKVHKEQQIHTVFQWLTRHILEGMKNGCITTPPPVVSRAFHELDEGVAAFYRMAAITDTPFPFPYAQLLTLFLVLHAAFSAFILAAQFEVHLIWVCGMTFAGEVGLWGLNLIAAEIEQPFGDDPNDMDFPESQRRLNFTLMNMLHHETQWVPQQTPVHCHVLKNLALVKSPTEKLMHDSLKVEEAVFLPESFESEDAISTSPEKEQRDSQSVDSSKGPTKGVNNVDPERKPNRARTEPARTPGEANLLPLPEEPQLDGKKTLEDNLEPRELPRNQLQKAQEHLLPQELRRNNGQSNKPDISDQLERAEYLHMQSVAELSGLRAILVRLEERCSPRPEIAEPQAFPNPPWPPASSYVAQTPVEEVCCANTIGCRRDLSCILHKAGNERVIANHSEHQAQPTSMQVSTM